LSIFTKWVLFRKDTVVATVEVDTVEVMEEDMAEGDIVVDMGVDMGIIMGGVREEDIMIFIPIGIIPQRGITFLIGMLQKPPSLLSVYFIEFHFSH
jgi:hypothetical protein